MNPSDTILGTYQAINLNVELITESQLVVVGGGDT